MNLVGLRRLAMAAATVAAVLGVPSVAAAQVGPCPAPANLPPANSPTLLRCLQLVAHPVNETVVEQETYQYYIKVRGSVSTTNTWVPYNEDALKSDFWNLWRT